MATTETLEQKAERLFQFIYQHLMEWAKAPSQREMAEECQMSRETVIQCLHLLEKQGKAIYKRGKPRKVTVREMREED